jgi:prolyl-tRNA editing enzyme YbaK/EbsC (Cys-tRNA(Pro) deacylase)
MNEIQRSLEELLKSKGVVYNVIEHDPVLTMEDVERVLGVALNQTAKTLVIKNKAGFVLVVVPGHCRVDKKKLAGVLGTSRKHLDMVPKEEVEQITQLPIGAIPPFGLGFKVVMDESLLSLNKVYCGFASLTESLEIDPKDIHDIAEAQIGDIIAGEGERK